MSVLNIIIESISIVQPLTEQRSKCQRTTEHMESGHTCASNHRFSIINLSINSNLVGKDGLHANAIIVDHVRKEYERFEPRGALPEPRESIVNDIMDKEFRAYFSLQGYTYISPSSFCPLVGRIERKKKKSKLSMAKPYGPQSWAKKGDVKGTCIFWSLYYIEQRLLHPELSRNDFMHLLMQKTPEDLTRIIRNFIVKIHYQGFSVKERLYKEILHL